MSVVVYNDQFPNIDKWWSVLDTIINFGLHKMRECFRAKDCAPSS